MPTEEGQGLKTPRAGLSNNFGLFPSQLLQLPFGKTSIMCYPLLGWEKRLLPSAVGPV